MLFNKKIYYEKVKTIENIAVLRYIFTIVLIIIIAVVINKNFFQKDVIIPIIIGIVIGLFLGYGEYNKSIIKAEEMKMKIDIYDKVMKIKE